MRRTLKLLSFHQQTLRIHPQYQSCYNHVLHQILASYYRPIPHVRYVNGPSQTSPDPAPNPLPVDTPSSSQDEGSKNSSSSSASGSTIPKGAWKLTAFKMAEAALTTFASISILALVGYSYTIYYKKLVLNKIDNAFAPGDPMLDLAFRQKSKPHSRSFHSNDEDNIEWVHRPEQEILDQIVAGINQDHYWLLIGEKGTGKSSMLLKAMRQISGEGVAWIEVHADLEVFRVRLGKALDFEYHEDNIGSLFSIRGPRDASALLDVERAFNKLEKVALKRRAKDGKPLVVVFNSVHLLRDDKDGRDLLELIQQRAEAWAAANLVTVVMNSDDYWVYERLKNYGTRMQILPIRDLTKQATVNALKIYRKNYYNEELSSILLDQIYNRLGGRLNYLNRVAKESDMLKTCEEIEDAERTWFLNKCWIFGSGMDDDVMDQQKYASAAMVLAKALVDLEADTTTYDELGNIILPEYPLHKAREIMTRADFIQSYDHDNIFTIDAWGKVRADSVPMMQAFRTVCRDEGFDKFLEDTLDRISDIESLGRTREVTLKDLWNKGKYRFETKHDKVLEMETILDAPNEKE